MMTTIIILAAGASTRLGSAKQTLNYKDKSLLKHTIDAAVNAETRPVVVVIGAREKEIYEQIQKEPVALVTNKNWKDGMASSIKMGLEYVLHLEEDTENIILMVCDQPFADESLLLRLIETKQKTGKPIVACAYNDTIGVPALFSKQFFRELLALKGEEGGKKILSRHFTSVASVPFPHGAVDIDTAADYEDLKARSGNP